MGIGKTTYEILKLPEYTSKPEKCAEFIWRMKGSDLPPNGALMRNAAVAIHNYENEKKLLENCKRVCQLTHFDPRCVDSCQIHGLLLYRVINGGDTSLKSLCAGLWGYYYSESFESGLLTIIHEGGDADTNGCIAGTLMAAKFDKIPQKWIAGLKNHILLN